jgi:hypothetical protein
LRECEHVDDYANFIPATHARRDNDAFADPESLARKAEYVKANKLGGVMIWEISTDDERGSLINALDARLR